MEIINFYLLIIHFLLLKIIENYIWILFNSIFKFYYILLFDCFILITYILIKAYFILTQYINNAMIWCCNNIFKPFH